MRQCAALYYTAVGLEKCDREQTENRKKDRKIRKFAYKREQTDREQRTDRQTEKAITEATLIVNGLPG